MRGLAGSSFPHRPAGADHHILHEVDINDLTIVLANFGQTGRAWSQGCMDGYPTGAVDVDDFTIVLSNFGYGTTPGAGPAAAPEPCALVLLLAALACLLARRPRLPSAAAAQTSRSASGTHIRAHVAPEFVV
jgi:hypothetical protein